jgi:hypothetical protein
MFSAIPRSLLSPNTRYTVTIGTSLRSVSGAYLSTPYTLIFTTRQ